MAILKPNVEISYHPPGEIRSLTVTKKSGCDSFKLILTWPKQCAASTTLHTFSSLQIFTIASQGRKHAGHEMMPSMIATTLFDSVRLRDLKWARKFLRTSSRVVGNLIWNGLCFEYGAVSMMDWMVFFTPMKVVVAEFNR